VGPRRRFYHGLQMNQAVAWQGHDVTLAWLPIAPLRFCPFGEVLSLKAHPRTGLCSFPHATSSTPHQACEREWRPHGEPRTNRYCKNAARSANTSSKGTHEVGQSNRGPTRTQWNKFDAEPKRQGAHDVRCLPEENCEGSKGAVGQGEAGTKGEILVNLTFWHWS
jgi:hypothetical protein